jgi:hypothetical protein
MQDAGNGTATGDIFGLGSSSNGSGSWSPTLSWTTSNNANNPGKVLVGTTTAPVGAAVQMVIDNSNGGGIEFATNNNGGGAVVPATGGGLSFLTFTGAVGSETYSTRLAITSAGTLNIVGAGTAGSTQTVSFNGSAPVNSLVLDSSGNVTIGTTTTVGSRVLAVAAPTGSRATMKLDNSSQVWNTSVKGDAGQNYYFISNPAETVGVYMTPSASGWNNLSDERAKENWIDLENAVQSIKQIRTGTFSWVADKSLPRDVGLIAQDVLSVLPEAVDTSNPDQLGVRYTHVVPLLLAALKEQQKIIETLEIRLTTLETV